MRRVLWFQSVGQAKMNPYSRYKHFMKFNDPNWKKNILLWDCSRFVKDGYCQWKAQGPPDTFQLEPEMQDCPVGHWGLYQTTRAEKMQNTFIYTHHREQRWGTGTSDQHFSPGHMTASCPPSASNVHLNVLQFSASEDTSFSNVKQETDPSVVIIAPTS